MQIKALITTALLGTERRPLPVISSDSPLAGILHHLQGESVESQLLNAAATHFLRQQAGYVVPTDENDLPVAAPTDERPLCTENAAAFLSDILNTSGYEGILPEWLRLLVNAGQRVPPEFIPDLLDIGNIHHKSLLLNAIGERGRWLLDSHQAKKWNYLRTEEEAPQQVELFAPVDNALAETEIVEGLRKHLRPMDKEHPVFHYLQAYDGTWSQRISQAVLQNIKPYLSATYAHTRPDTHLQDVFHLIALRLSPEALDTAEQVLRFETQGAFFAYWSQMVQHLIDVLQFRHDMLKEFPRS
jgi:hypothetical protein